MPAFFVIKKGWTIRRHTLWNIRYNLEHLSQFRASYLLSGKSWMKPHDATFLFLPEERSGKNGWFLGFCGRRPIFSRWARALPDERECPASGDDAGLEIRAPRYSVFAGGIYRAPALFACGTPLSVSRQAVNAYAQSEKRPCRWNFFWRVQFHNPIAGEWWLVSGGLFW